MTGKVIEEMLGPNWWEREHDQTALCALLDRVMEAEEFRNQQLASVWICMQAMDAVIEDKPIAFVLYRRWQEKLLDLISAVGTDSTLER